MSDGSIAAIVPFAAMQANAPDMAAMAMPPLPSMPGTATGRMDAASATGPFGRLVSHGLDSINTDLIASQAGLQELAMGQSRNLHQIMMRLEESRLSFQLLMQARNRLLEAYQDVMKMQV